MVEFSSSKRSPASMCLAFSAFAGLMRLACVTGLIGSDDLGYSWLAQLLADGEYQLEHHHFAIRFTVFVPLAAIYKVFGVSEATTIAFPLLCSSLSVGLLAVLATRMFDERVGIYAGLLYATSPVHVRYATVLIPEPVAEMFVVAAILLMFCASKDNYPRFSLISGILVGVGYLAKEPVVFIGLSLALYLCIGRRWQLLASFLLGCVVIVVAEHTYYVVSTGDLLFRLHSMGVHELTPMAIGANENLYDRLLKVYPRMMLIPNVHFGGHSVFCIVLAGIAVKMYSLRDDRVLLLFLCAFIPWVYLNFGSSALDHYFALPSAPRYIGMTYLPLYVGGAAALARLSIRKTSVKHAVHTCVLLLGIIGFACALTTSGTGYRTNEVKVLRVVAAKLREQKVDAVAMVSVSEFRRRGWTAILKILETNISVVPVDKSFKGLFLTTDAIGLPTAKTIEGQTIMPPKNWTNIDRFIR